VGTEFQPRVHGPGILKNASTKIIGQQPGDVTPLITHLNLNPVAVNQVKGFGAPRKGRSAEVLLAIEREGRDDPDDPDRPYLVSNYDLLLFLVKKFDDCRRPVYFGLQQDFLTLRAFACQSKAITRLCPPPFSPC
jgi:hypothetical protein